MHRLCTFLIKKYMVVNEIGNKLEYFELKCFHFLLSFILSTMLWNFFFSIQKVSLMYSTEFYVTFYVHV